MTIILRRELSMISTFINDWMNIFEEFFRNKLWFCYANWIGIYTIIGTVHVGAFALKAFYIGKLWNFKLKCK